MARRPSSCRSCPLSFSALLFAAFWIDFATPSLAATSSTAAPTSPSSTAVPPSSVAADAASVVKKESTAPVVETGSKRAVTVTAKEMIRVVFSDVDGTLVHYHPSQPPSPDANFLKNKGDERQLISLPRSATGTRGIISYRTLQLCRKIRRQEWRSTQQEEKAELQGQTGSAGPPSYRVRLVLVSGMRTSTLLQRLPYLPRADAYCSEGGGRIFYPVSGSLRQQPPEDDQAGADAYHVVPAGEVTRWEDEEDRVEGEEDLLPFYVVEDTAWRRRIADKVGDDGYVGNELRDFSMEGSRSTTEIPIAERSGPLWAFAKELMRRGYVLDATGYASCFRINRKQQSPTVNFDALLLRNSDEDGGSSSFVVPPGLGTSTNLGCVDVYAEIGGKKNCCSYLAERFCGSQEALGTRCVCLCDDDNDLEMALACGHAFVPSITSESMAEAVQRHRDRFTVTASMADGGGIVVEGTNATEAALERVLDMIHKGESDDE